MVDYVIIYDPDYGLESYGQSGQAYGQDYSQSAMMLYLLWHSMITCMGSCHARTKKTQLNSLFMRIGNNVLPWSL